MVTTKAKIYLLYCATSYDHVEVLQGITNQNIDLKTISIPCSGKVDILYLTKAFETGADGVAVMVCKKGECRYLEGNLRARKRAEAVESLLEEVGLGRGRIAVIQLGDGGVKQAINDVNKFCLEIVDHIGTTGTPQIQTSGIH